MQSYFETIKQHNCKVFSPGPRQYALKARRCLPVASYGIPERTSCHPNNCKCECLNKSWKPKMDVWRENIRAEYQIRRKSPSLDVWASHQSRHDEPQKPMRKRQARHKNSLKCKMLPFEGLIRRDGHRNWGGSSNAWHEFEDLERIPVSRLEAFYRAATFFS